ncbi:MAG: LysE family translocator [Pseudomonadota bacterium]
MITLEFLATSFLVVLMPGSGVLYTIATGLIAGRRASVFAAIGCTFGIVPSLLASITGLAILIHTSAIAFQTIKFLGVAYLLYLAWSMLRSDGELTFSDSPKPDKSATIALKGFLINILNPKLTIFFLAFLPQFIPVDEVNPAVSMIALGSVFMFMTFLIFVVYGCMADRIRHHVVGSPVVANWIQKSFAGAFALMGAKLAFASRD